LGLFDNGDVRVGILPEREEIRIGVFGLGYVARNNVRSTHLQVRQDAYRIGGNDASMIENFLEFRRGLLATPCREVTLAADVGRIESAEFGEECRAWHREVVRKRPLQLLDCVQRRAMGERRKSA